MKRIIILALIAFASTSVFAQFSLGLKVGYNTSLGFDQNWKYSNANVSFKNDISNGFHAGLYARIGRAFYVQPELLYNLAIYNQKIGNSELSTKKITASTIDVPVLAGWSIVNNKSFKLRIMAGPKFSFNVGSTKLDTWENVQATARAARVGLDTGIGIDVFFLAIDLRYNLMSNLYAFKDIVNEDKLNVSPNNSFTISLGFKLFGNNARR